MPANSIEVIYRFEEAIESTVKGILLEQAELNAHRQRDSAEVVSPWAAIQLSGVSAEGAQHVISNVGWPSDFSANLAVAIATNRVKEGDGSISHTTALGLVRRYLYDLTQWTDGALPYLKVWNVMETGTTPNIADDDRLDTTLITFRIKFLIREDAWP